MSRKRRILFVDDEPNILDGLRRMLHTLHQEWDMEFASSGPEALKILSEKPFDVIVSDMRMPGMTGFELLTKVKDLYPRMIRIVLSGHSNQEMILKSVGPIHQYLSKPCDTETLKDIVTRACRLRDLLNEESLRNLVSQLESLPSLPNLYKEIIDELNSPDCSMQRVGKIIDKDIGMTAKILQLVNSAFFGIPRHISSPAEAATLLGLDVIRSLVLTLQIFSGYDQKNIKHFQIERLCNHCITTGIYAREIAKAEKMSKKEIDDTLLAGLLHDIGRLVLVFNLPDRYDKVLELFANEKLELEDAERKVFGASHSEVGGYLVGLWGLPDPILEAIYFHHRPMLGPDKGFGPITVVYVANALDGGGIFSNDLDTETIVDMEYLDKIGMLDRYPEWVKLCGVIAEKEQDHE